ncbi:MAG: helix-turn-helix domain-containing protein [Bacteroidales bacterium]|nr:helix-turn-helix domain-containing protein [Bacteroidales bacterium]
MKDFFCLKLKRIHIWIVLLVLLTPSVVCSWHNCNLVRSELLADMNQALEKTLAQQQSFEITPDTVQNYLQNLQIPQLREQSFISYALPQADHMLCSERRRWSEDCEFQSYATCSVISLWFMSDKRLPLFFICLSVLWLAFSACCCRQQLPEKAVRIGEICMISDVFYNRYRQPLHFTPLQEQLMKMFFMSEGHRLSKQEICDTLWPRKPDASETLYTLVKRLKPVVEEQGGLQIKSERGKEYILEEK